MPENRYIEIRKGTFGEMPILHAYDRQGLPYAAAINNARYARLLGMGVPVVRQRKVG